MKVKFTGCSDAQVNWGRGEDPRQRLEYDKIYDVEKIEEHSWHTLYYINGVPYNSSTLQVIDDTKIEKEIA
jgi:hypothetical protein